MIVVGKLTSHLNYENKRFRISFPRATYSLLSIIHQSPLNRFQDSTRLAIHHSNTSGRLTSPPNNTISLRCHSYEQSDRLPRLNLLFTRGTYILIFNKSSARVSNQGLQNVKCSKSMSVLLRWKRHNDSWLEIIFVGKLTSRLNWNNKKSQTSFPRPINTLLSILHQSPLNRFQDSTVSGWPSIMHLNSSGRWMPSLNNPTSLH